MDEVQGVEGEVRRERTVVRDQAQQSQLSFGVRDQAQIPLAT